MGFRLALCVLIVDKLELAYFKVINVARQILQNAAIYNDCVSGSRIGNQPSAIDCHH